MEEGPKVVAEIPIYVSQTLASRAVLYQYSLESNLQPRDATVVDCKLKNDNEVMIDLERNYDSANYNRSKAEQMALNADGTKNTEDLMFPSKFMDKELLMSKKLPGQTVAVGIFADNEIHLCPAKAVALLRPSFRYLDKGDKRTKQESKEAGEDGSEDEEELQQVTVKFARSETERAKKAREKSFSYLSKQSAQQSWYRANYHDSKSSTAELELRKLFCDSSAQRVVETRPEGEEAIRTVVQAAEGGSEIAEKPAHGLPLTRLQSLPTLLERVTAIMMEARVIQLATLYRLLGEPASNLEAQDRIKVVQHVAVLVQGCWVIQSDALIPKDSTPDGVPGALMRCARDYILYLFTKNRTVTRKKVMEEVKLPGDVVRGILEQFSKVNAEKQWEFILPTDHHFIAQYPDVVQRQQAKWDLRYQILLSGLRPPEVNSTQSRNRRRSGRDSFSSDTDTDGKRSHGTHKPRRARISESKAPEHT